jgi:hypothetical protein
MKARLMTIGSDLRLHKKKRMSSPEPEWIGAKTQRQLMREGLETRLRDLKARLDQFEERKREQNQRDYVVPITIVSRQELDRL